VAVRHPGGWGPLSTGGASWRGGGTGALEGDVLVVDLHFTVLGPRVEEDEEWSTCVASSYQRMEEIPARLAPFAAVPDPVRTWRAAHPGQELRGWSEVSADLLEVFTAVTPERLAELDRYRADLKRAEAEYLERLEAESQLAEVTGEPLQIDVRFSRVQDLAASADRWDWGVGRTSVGLSLWMLALAAGLTMAAGLGLFAAGAAMEPTLDSVSELRQLAEVPIVRKVPAPVTVPPAYGGAARAWLRALLCLAGLLLMTGCVTLVWRALFTTW